MFLAFPREERARNWYFVVETIFNSPQLCNLPGMAGTLIIPDYDLAGLLEIDIWGIRIQEKPFCL
jgi:hypothetical protein